MSEAVTLSQPKIKATNMERYGAENVLSKGTSPWGKRNKTVKEKYGVDNVFQLDEIKKQCIRDREDYQRVYRGVWASKSPEYKQKWLDDSLFKVGTKKRHGGIWDSKIEGRFADILGLMSITFTSHYRIKNYPYDFKIGKILIEIQGDYWHANPNRYKAEDSCFYSGQTAKDIWEKDDRKKKLAETNGYKVIWIWESDMNKLDDVELIEFVAKEIENVG